jgi:hypothetical protein
MKRPCDECKERFDKIEAYRKNMAHALQDVIQICEEHSGSYYPIGFRQIRARALNGLNCLPREQARSCGNCEHSDEGIDPYCNKLYQHCPKVVAGWHCSDWEEAEE